MDEARSEMLARVRHALADRPAPGPVRRDYDLVRPVDDPVALFVERVTEYRATVTRTSEHALRETVAGALSARGARTVATPAGLPVEWQPAGVDWRPEPDLPTLDRCDGVLTGCAVAIAETGTIVLDGDADQGRRAVTLVPDYHLCVVRADQIAVSVPEALARLEPTRPLTFISGPSATSDIELDRVEGVHGPRTLEILLVETTS